MRFKRASERRPSAAPASGGDLIGALPDEILHRVLSFLPAPEAVRTCVLARRWLNLWKSATGLRIVGADGKAPAGFAEIRVFVDELLLLRGRSPLETFEISVAGAGVDVRRLGIWVRHAVLCEIQVLRLNVLRFAWPRLEDPPSLASSHLTRVELCGLEFNDGFLDFSKCPALQHLHIEDCFFYLAKRISSQSLKHLNITKGKFGESSRTRIHAPNLASLVLQDTYGRTPVLERMPLLASALVVILQRNCDSCIYDENGDCGYESCKRCIRDETLPVLLHGLSEAKTLELRAVAEMFVFRRDLKRCPTFRRLKSLTINEHWCVPDEKALACILEHSPVLEKLSLILFDKLPGIVTMEGRFNSKELPPTISQHLKRVEVRCGGVDEMVLKVLKFLSKLNISFSFKE